MSFLFGWVTEKLSRAIAARQQARQIKEDAAGVIPAHCEVSDAARFVGADSMLDFAFREHEKKRATDER